MDDATITDSANRLTAEMAEYPYGPRPHGPASKADRIGPTPSNELLVVTSEAWLLLAIAIGSVFAVGNFAICPLGEALGRPDWRAVPVFVLFGGIVAQAGLLSAAIVFGPGTFWRRMLICWGAGLSLWSCWAAGLGSVAFVKASYRSSAGEVLPFISFSLPLLALAIQSPLWFFRCYLGWRLVPSNRQQETSRPLSIGDYFLGTAIAAVSIASARLAPQPQWDMSSYWPVWAIVFASVAGMSLVSIIPAMLLMFRWRDWRAAFFLLVLYGFVAGVTTIAIVSAIFGPPGGPSPQWQLIAIMVVFVSLAVFLGAVMMTARGLEFELVLGNRPHA